MQRVFLLLAILVAFVGAAGVISESLVFTDGSRLDGVKAELKSDLVWVTLASGAMQAYPVEEVDLEASGLLAKPTPVAAAETVDEGPEISGAVRLQEAQAKSGGISSMKITDADVEHVSVEELAPEEGSGVGVHGPLTVSDVRHKRIGDKIQVTGVVTNTTYRPVGNVRIDVTAIDAEGRPIGTGQRNLGRNINAQERASFSVDVLGSGVAADVRVRARSASGDGAPVGKGVPPRSEAQSGTRSRGRSGDDG